MNQKIAITAIASFSPLGMDSETVWKNYQSNKTVIQEAVIGNNAALVASIPQVLKNQIQTLQNSDSKYKSLDNVVLYAIIASRIAIQKAGWTTQDTFGINIGSSRGATQILEKSHREFLQTGKAPLLSSPNSTLGNISSWVAHDLQSNGPELSHSITCSTALHSVLNGVAWLRAGMATKFLVGGSEAPLTPFTIAQMKALKIYAQEQKEYPCQAFNLKKTTNTMVLGEASADTCIEIGQKNNALAYIEGLGYATEILEHNVSISTEADCFQKSMKMALGENISEAIDVIVMHTPGTIKGDTSEFKAIQKIFGNQLPLLTTNKWKIGHTFGASGMMSFELAIYMLQHNQFIDIPYLAPQIHQKEIRKVMINAVGFGGNAVSIVISKP